MDRIEGVVLATLGAFIGIALSAAIPQTSVERDAVGGIAGCVVFLIGRGVWRRRHVGSRTAARRALSELLAPGEQALWNLELSEAHAPHLDYSHGPVDSSALVQWESGPQEAITDWRVECERVIRRTLSEADVRQFQSPNRALPIPPMPTHMSDGRQSGLWEDVARQIAWLHQRQSDLDASRE